jgi:two-component sensor histidine kinase
VHETLSHTPEEIVDFDDIARRVAAMAGEVSAPETRVVPVVSGGFGLLPAAIATPLALVLTELLQNALQHGLAGWRGSAAGGSVLVSAARNSAQLTVSVEDNGAGLPDGFSLDGTTSLGLQIVRTLVETELGGRLTIAPRSGGGTAVVVDLPITTVAPGPSAGPESDSGDDEEAGVPEGGTGAARIDTGRVAAG